MGEGDIGNTIGLVDFDPDKRFGLRGVLDIVAAVVGENGGVSGAKVECTGFGISEEDGGASFTLVEVEPFLGLL